MIKPTMEISLTKGQVTIIDADDFGKVAGYNWRVQTCPSMPGFYAARSEHLSEAYAAGKKTFKRTVLMHREIVGAIKGQDVDHINGNTLDNRRENLRLCNRAQNCHNQKIRSTNKSGFKGVCFKKGNVAFPWQAYIACAGKRFHLGYFSTPEEASKSYNEAAKRLHGEFASLPADTTQKASDGSYVSS